MKTPRAMPGPRESLHKAMAAIIQTPDWWSMGAAEALSKAMSATNGTITPQAILKEFYALLDERGAECEIPHKGRLRIPDGHKAVGHYFDESRDAWVLVVEEVDDLYGDGPLTHRYSDSRNE